MRLKNFFKPTKGKIAVLIILFFLAIFVNVVTARSRVAIQKGIEINELKVKIFEGIETVLFYPAYLLAIHIIVPKTHVGPSGFLWISPVETLLLFTVMIFYWYLLSCLLIFVYERLKKIRKR